MSTPARKRLMRDFKRLQQDPPAGISGAPQDNNIMLWNAVIFGWVYFCSINTEQAELLDAYVCLNVSLYVNFYTVGHDILRFLFACGLQSR